MVPAMTLDDWTTPKGMLIVGMVALVSGGAAAITSSASSRSRLEARLARILEIDDAASVGRFSPGDSVLVRGKLAPDNAALFRGYVAYLEYEPYRKRSGSRRKRAWQEVRRETPALRVETARGVLHVRNTDYLLGAAVLPPADLEEWASTSWKGAPASGLPGSADHWFTGFKAGEPVMVLGTLRRTEPVREVEAMRVFGGNPLDMASAAERSSQTLTLLTYVLFAVCAVAVAALGWLGLRYVSDP